MSDPFSYPPQLSAEQQAIRAKCFHPTGTFEEFKEEEIEQSISERFEKIVRKYPENIAVKDQNQTLTYKDLNDAANRIAKAILEGSGASEDPIVLLLENDAVMISAIFASINSGKMYV